MIIAVLVTVILIILLVVAGVLCYRFKEKIALMGRLPCVRTITYRHRVPIVTFMHTNFDFVILKIVTKVILQLFVVGPLIYKYKCIILWYKYKTIIGFNFDLIYLHVNRSISQSKYFNYSHKNQPKLTVIKQ